MRSKNRGMNLCSHKERSNGALTHSGAQSSLYVPDCTAYRNVREMQLKLVC